MPTHQNLMGLCWLGSQEDIRPPLGSHINQNAYAGLLVGAAWERSGILYVTAPCGAGAVTPRASRSPHIAFVVLACVHEEVQ